MLNAAVIGVMSAKVDFILTDFVILVKNAMISVYHVNQILMDSSGIGIVILAKTDFT